MKYYTIVESSESENAKTLKNGELVLEKTYSDELSAIAKIEVGQKHLYPDEIVLFKQLLKVKYDDIFKL